MANNQAIGVFDSGVGGLSVLRTIYQQLPKESLLYIADTKYVPYGEKEASFIVERCVKVTDYFIAQQLKAMVIACNTATAAAAELLRAKYPNLPIIAMEPAVKPATQATKSGKVGVLATSSTLRSARFAALLDRFASHVEVFPQPCPGLVECIEAGDLMGDQPRQLLQKYLQPMLDKGCDTIILGCTHYPFLRPLLAELLPDNVKIIDTGEAVTKHLKYVLENQQLQASEDNQRSITMLTTGDFVSFEQVLSKLWVDEHFSVQPIAL